MREADTHDRQDAFIAMVRGVRLQDHDVGEVADYYLKGMGVVERELHALPDILTGVAETIKNAISVQYTGWFVLVKQVDDKWECVACIHPDDPRWQEEELPDYTMMLPIPETFAAPEFNGF